MSFDWKDYVSLSEELARRKEESCLRSSISRGYYGVFCIARNKMGYKSYEKADVHSKVMQALKKARAGDWRKIGWNLDELRRARNDADYDEEKQVKKGLAERMLILAKGVLEKLESV